MEYSGEFDASKLAPCFAALAASFPDWKLSVRNRSKEVTGDAAMTLLRTEPAKLWPLEVILSSSDRKEIQIRLSQAWGLLMVNVEGASEENERQIHDLIRGVLRLNEPTDEEWENVASLPNINMRVLRLTKMVEELARQIKSSAQSKSRLTCFVSFRFDEHSKALAFELRDFLELAELGFVSGLGYEPRSISEKVLERLSGKIDLFIVISAEGSDSAWLNQEIGVASARGIPVMVLREQGTSFNPGVLSDTEYAEFPRGTISGAYIQILQAIRYIRIKSDAT